MSNGDCIRHILQDWDVWLSKKDNKGNDVNLHIENIYLDDLQQDGLLVYERIKVRRENFTDCGSHLQPRGHIDYI